MVFMNTVVTRGRGEVAVTATGMVTGMGRLSRDLAEAREPRSPLQRQLDDAGKRLGLIEAWQDDIDLGPVGDHGLDAIVRPSPLGRGRSLSARLRRQERFGSEVAAATAAA